MAVEHEDDSTCEPCEKVDGKLYRTRAEAYADYPGGVGYVNCVGAKYGNSCRGRVVKRRGAQRKGDQSMTDVSLLNRFRACLAEHQEFLAKQAPRAPQPSKTGNWFTIENAHAEEATVRILSEIGMFGVSAQGFIDELNAVSAPKIRVEINSPGGDVFDGIAIHTALATHRAHVTTFITGLAASAASYIAMAGDLILMARNAMLMIHDASGLTWGNEADHLAQARLLGKVSDNIADMYALQAGGTAEEWRARMRTETWYTGTEALAAGLVDEITDADEEEPSNASRLSIAAFHFANRAQAPDPVISATAEESPEIAETTETEPSPETDEETPDLVDGELLLNSSSTDVADTMLAILAERIRAGR